MPRALILVAEGFEDRDVLDTAATLHGYGYETRFAAPERGVTYTGTGGRKVVSDLGYLNVNIGAYDLVLVPGGPAADKLTEHKSMYNIVYSMLHKGRAAGIVGDGIKVLLAAASIKQSPNPVETGTQILRGGIVEGREIACPEAHHEAVAKAGGVCVDRPLAVSGPLVTVTDLDGHRLTEFIETVVPVAQEFAFTPHEFA